MAVRRKGFTNGDDLIKGGKFADYYDGAAGDDVMIGFGGNDTLVGSSGQDDLSGGTGNDVLIGGSWLDNVIANGVVDFVEFTQDAYKDTYVAESSFALNGTDTVYGYDQELDTVEVKALASAVTTIAAALYAGDNSLVTAQDLVDGGYVEFADGALNIDLNGGGDGLATWFTLWGSPLITTPVGWVHSSSVTVEVTVVGVEYSYVFEDAPIG